MILGPRTLGSLLMSLDLKKGITSADDEARDGSDGGRTVRHNSALDGPRQFVVMWSEICSQVSLKKRYAQNLTAPAH